MRLSIIIPTFNESENIGTLIRHLRSSPGAAGAEIIVSDGGSDDDTLATAAAAGATAVCSPLKGRAGQMNHGAALATGEVFHFIHADSRPPLSFAADIEQALALGYDCGSFRSRFDRNTGLRRLNSFFTRFDFLFCRGGDQSIFLTRALWEKAGPYDTDMRIMEEYDLLTRIRKTGNFRLVPKDTIVSARKYDNNSWLRVQRANLKIVRMWRRGASQQEMIDAYRAALDYRKSAF